MNRAIVVLGSGVAGLTLGWELARRGHPPLVVGGAEPPTSLVAAGMLSPSPEQALTPALGELARAALSAYPGFLDALAEDTDHDVGYRRDGLLRVAYSEEDAGRLQAEAGRWLEPAACLAEADGVGRRGLVGALLTEDEAQVQPSWMLAALRAALIHRGAELREGRVEAMKARPGGVVVHLAGGEALEADSAVLALGSWTSRLPGLGHLLRPVKGQLLVFTGEPGPRRIVYWGHNYLLTKADGTVILGGTMEEAGFDLRPTEPAQELRRLLPVLWPALVDAPADVRVGLRPCAADGLPVVGPLPEIPGVYVFSAHFRNGFLLSPVTAELAAAELLGDVLNPALEPLRPARLG